MFWKMQSQIAPDFGVPFIMFFCKNVQPFISAVSGIVTDFVHGDILVVFK